jgi:hypothetical protein
MEEWERKLAEVTKNAWADFHKSGFTGDNFKQGVINKIEAWVKANPPPPQAVVKGGESARVVKTTGQTIEEINMANRSAQAAKLAEGERMLGRMRRANGFRRGVEGTMTLGTIVGVAGTMGLGTGAVLVAKAALKLLIEDMAISGAISLTEHALTAWEQATMPSTVREAECMYQSYAQSRRQWVRFPDEKFGTFVELPLERKEVWLAKTYGVRWDALSK